MPRSGIAPAEPPLRIVRRTVDEVDHADSAVTRAAVEVTRAALVAERDGTEAAAVLPAGTDEEALIDELRTHRVIDLVTPHATALGFGTEAADRLRQRRTAAVRRGLLMTAGTALASAALAEAGIDHLVVKGVAIPAVLGRQPALRGAGDIDIWIAEGDLGAAEGALAVRGWRHPQDVHIIDPAGAGRARAWLRWVYRATSLEHDRQPPIDLHWRLTNDGRELSFGFAAALARSVPLPSVGPTVRTLAPADALEHVAQHGRKELFAFLRQVVDVVQLAGACDPEALRRRCRDNRNVRLALATAGRLAPWLGDLVEVDRATGRLRDEAWHNCLSLQHLHAHHQRKTGVRRVHAAVARESWIVRSSPGRVIDATELARFAVKGVLAKRYSPVRPLARRVPALDEWYWGPRP